VSKWAVDTDPADRYIRLAGIALLALGCLLVIWPFLGAILFAGVLVLSTWPIYAALRSRVGGSPTRAALLIVLALLVLLALPVALAAQSLFVHSSDVVDWARGLIADPSRISVPDFVRNIPVVGPSIQEYGQRLLGSREELIEVGRRLVDPAKTLLVAMGQGVGAGLVQMLVALFVSFFLYRDGDQVRRLLGAAIARVAGDKQGPALVATAQAAVKGVVYGLIGTAIAQAAVALLGFLIAGVPGAMLLAALTFILSLVPMGPVLIWGGAAIWLYAQGETGWCIFMVIYGAAVISSVDNFVKPILMSRAGGLSMLLVVLGVFGGAIAFGFIGLFVGPALLAVGWNTTKVWLGMVEQEGTPA
jgi:predicted PurR-regulated permease PerM